jgi:photosystem II stability/assembly factor-like uncharacterized protein
MLAIAGEALPTPDAPKALKPSAAVASPIFDRAMMLGADWAGPRAVSVGDHGIVLLSDDRGAHWRQSRQVPVSSTLTAVSFADERRGWAVGHWGAILATEDRPLLSVHFFDGMHGVAVGLWSLVLTTSDGGKSWKPEQLPSPPGSKKADLNLLHLFADPRGVLYAAAERGMVLRSDDRGQNWTYLETGYKGTFWTGIALPDGTLLVGGQRGTIYRSADTGRQWTVSPTDSKNSVTAFAMSKDKVLAVGLDGLRALSVDGGQSFQSFVRPDRVSLTAALSIPGGSWLVLSQRGVVADVDR